MTLSFLIVLEAIYGTFLGFRTASRHENFYLLSTAGFEHGVAGIC